MDVAITVKVGECCWDQEEKATDIEDNSTTLLAEIESTEEGDEEPNWCIENGGGVLNGTGAAVLTVLMANVLPPCKMKIHLLLLLSNPNSLLLQAL